MPDVELPERRGAWSKRLDRRARELRAKVERALGAQRAIPIMKDDVIAYLAATDWPPSRRGELYRDWCEVTGTFCSAPDLKRARAGRRREMNRKLDFSSEDGQ